MNIIDEFLGMPVLVDPKLKHSFRDLDNKVGTIYSAPPGEDYALVEFGQDGTAAFPIESLLVLRDRAKIRHDADYDSSFLSLDDYEEIMEIAGLIEHAELESLKLAIRCSQKNPVAMEYTMYTLPDALDLRRNQFISRKL